MPKVGSGDNKELIFFASIHVKFLRDVIHDVIDKHVYV